MKTFNTTSLLVLLVTICSLSVGCQQQTTGPTEPATVEAPSSDVLSSDPQTANPAAGTAEQAAANIADLAIAGSPIVQKNIEELAEQDRESAEQNQDSTDVASSEKQEPATPTIDIPAHWKRLSETQEIWLDRKNKQVIVGGKICLDAGPLEMLICPKGTKEHESIVSVNAESWQVHAALLAVGATPGVPARWVPEYTPAWGPKIDIQMMWRDEKTKRVKTIDGKQWILNSGTQKPMTTELVFGGSYSEPRMEGDRPRYLADDGELICLANFSTSTIDLRIIDKKDIDIFFETNTPLIPPVNTQIYTILKPGVVVGKPEP